MFTLKNIIHMTMLVITLVLGLMTVSIAKSEDREDFALDYPGMEMLPPPEISPANSMAQRAQNMRQDMYSNIPVLKRSIQTGEVITSADIKIERIMTARMPQTLITDSAQLIGLEATRTIRSGTPLFPGYVREVPDLKKGSNVEMVFKKGSLIVTAYGQALEDGQIGETVRVMSDSSKQIIVGRVTNIGKIQVN